MYSVFYFHLRSVAILISSSFISSTTSIGSLSITSLGVKSLLTLVFCLLIVFSFSVAYWLILLNCSCTLLFYGGSTCLVLLWYVKSFSNTFSLPHWRHFFRSRASATVGSSMYFQCPVANSFLLLTHSVIFIPISLY